MKDLIKCGSCNAEAHTYCLKIDRKVGWFCAKCEEAVQASGCKHHTRQATRKTTSPQKPPTPSQQPTRKRGPPSSSSPKKPKAKRRATTTRSPSKSPSTKPHPHQPPIDHIPQPDLDAIFHDTLELVQKMSHTALRKILNLVQSQDSLTYCSFRLVPEEIAKFDRVLRCRERGILIEIQSKLQELLFAAEPATSRRGSTM